MGSEVVGLPENADACTQQAPRDTSRNGDHPPSALDGHGTADDVLLPQSPGIPVRVCIPFCPDTVRPRGNDTVDNTFLLARQDKDDYVSLPQFFDTARDETDPVPRSKEGLHALSPAEDCIDVFLFRSGHAVFHPLVSC
jgi:hypothetical protein